VGPVSHNLASEISHYARIPQDVNCIPVGFREKTVRQLESQGRICLTDGERWYLVYTQPRVRVLLRLLGGLVAGIDRAR
jgi:hypothetical protein